MPTTLNLGRRAPRPCGALLVATYRRETLVRVAYEHRTKRCFTDGCAGTDDPLPLDYRLW
jgi:hypothetical protein